MSQQDSSARIAWSTVNCKKVIEFTHQVLKRPHIWFPLVSEKSHTQRDFVIAQSHGNEGGALFLARCQALATQLFEQEIQHFWINECLMTANHCIGNMLKVIRLHVAEKCIAMQSLLFAARTFRSAAPCIFASKNFSCERPTGVLGIDHNAQTRCYFEQCTSQFHAILISQPQVG